MTQVNHTRRLYKYLEIYPELVKIELEDFNGHELVTIDRVLKRVMEEARQEKFRRQKEKTS